MQANTGHTTTTSDSNRGSSSPYSNHTRSWHHDGVTYYVAASWFTFMLRKQYPRAFADCAHCLLLFKSVLSSCFHTLLTRPQTATCNAAIAAIWSIRACCILSAHALVHALRASYSVATRATRWSVRSAVSCLCFIICAVVCIFILGFELTMIPALLLAATLLFCNISRKGCSN